MSSYTNGLIFVLRFCNQQHFSSIGTQFFIIGIGIGINALDISQALEDDSSSSESNLIHDFTMAPSSLSSSSSDLSPSIVEACEAFNDSDDNSSASGFATDDEMVLFNVTTADDLPVPDIGARWTAADFRGLPDPDDCV
jgi:hypothetical protein